MSRSGFPAAAAALFLCAAAQVRAEAGWFDAGDVVLRNDLLLLNDAEVIRLPVGQWPLPRASVRYAVDHARPHAATNSAVSMALERVRTRLAESAGDSRGGEASLAGGESALLRNFGTPARDSGEARVRGSWSSGDRFEIGLSAAYAFDAEDGHDFRLDGSHATVHLGNWLLSANTLERWWGPAHDGGLILSSNARPKPTLLLERAEAREFESSWLKWLGPWRFSLGFSRMEGERQDIDSPLFMAWRVSVMPFKDIELGFSRTAQFCGEQLVCNVDSLVDMLIGNDNLGYDATPETEPGNQMAGFDIRWASPIGSWPYAVYGQMVGEDESSYLPAKYLAQFGIEAWHPFADGGVIQSFVEWADTSCSAISGSGPYYNCAYNQGLFNVEGYRYFGRSVGHTTDRDSRSAALGATYTTPSGSLWSATVRAAELNHDSNPDPTNPLAPISAEYAALELAWRGPALGGRLEVNLGMESVEPEGADGDVEPFGYVRWSKSFRP